ncbi:hypothetical protein [Pectobacterium carotovorum]|uniref:hypothetical protein n=1 Tax=Pectobacterium carotovorum TaxID=554 RepID=UPI000D72E7D3|nr:hypothetical protein [Pectobacterium carotovorum]PXB01169.1 hypothetical protein DMB41_16370 [Pectobacterium carotovorum subsp. carotovorum]
MAKLYGLDSSLIHDAKPNDGFVIDMVRASDYLELERQRGALLADNVALKDKGREVLRDAAFTLSKHNELCCEGYEHDGQTLHEFQALIETDATKNDAALREIGAKAVDKCAESLLANDDISVDYEYQAIKVFAQQLREGKV